MRTITTDDLRYETISDIYTCCKYLERQGIEIDMVTLGNAHTCIEEAVDDNQLPVIQVINPDNIIEGYIIEA